MTFRDQLTELIEEIGTLAEERRRVSEDYHDESPLPGMRLEFLRMRALQFAEGDPSAFQEMRDRLARNDQLTVLEDGFDSAGADVEELGDAVDEALGSLGDDSTSTVAGRIAAAWEGIEAAKSSMNGWAGVPAQFLTNLHRRATVEPAVVVGQLACVVTLGAYAAMYQETLTRARQALIDIAESTKEALDTRGGWGSATFALALATAATGPLVGPWVGAAIGMGSALVGLAEAGNSGEAEDKRVIEGHYTYEILDSMGQEISHLESVLDDLDRVIKDALDKDLDAISGLGRSQFLLDDLDSDLDNPAASTTGYVPLGSGAAKIAINCRDLYVAGYVYFSEAAYRYQSAATKLLLVGGEREAFGPWFGRSIGAWGTLCDDVRNIMLHARDYVAESGDALAQAAREYAQTDAESAELFDELLSDGTIGGKESGLGTLDEVWRVTTSLHEMEERSVVRPQREVF